MDDQKPEVEEEEEEEEEEKRECDTNKEDSTSEKVVVVDKKDKTVQPELNKVLPEDKGRAVKAMSQQAAIPIASVESDQLQEEDEEEDPILSEDEVCGGW